MHSITQIFGVLGLVSSLCLLVFAYLVTRYRSESNLHREECRRLVAARLESRFGKLDASLGRKGQAEWVGVEAGRSVGFVGAVPAAPVKMASAGQG
jgi:hypothetical protein